MIRALAVSCSFAALSLVVACTGKVSSSASGSDGGPDNVDDSKNFPPMGPQGTLVAACPSSKPTLGASCSPLGQLCEYGDDVSSQCNFIAHCSPEGAWESVSGDGCTTTLPTCGANVSDQASCNAGDPECTIPAGLCTCFDQSGGPARMDAGPDQYGYACADPDPRCPAWPKRPRIGSACSTPDLDCDYAPCGATGFAFRCDSGGFWSDAFSAQCGGA